MLAECGIGAEENQVNRHSQLHFSLQKKLAKWKKNLVYLYHKIYFPDGNRSQV